jgi:Methyltransferase domain
MMHELSKVKIANFLAARARNHLGLATSVARETFGDKIIFLDYPVSPSPRWRYDKPHPELRIVINNHRNRYIELLKSFLDFTENFVRIPTQATDSAPSEPNWMNGFIPALDAVALYSLIAMKRPKYYLEVGSGNSTKFARKAITDHQLDTKIISIDPHPRAEIDSLCDEVIRKPVEAVGLDLFDQLGPGDILYIDNSHRVFMNSDATAIFLDVIPRLKPGVLVEIHDVTLPFDYPNAWIGRYYSEQYLLAAYLLARGNRFEILLPNAFIDSDQELKSILLPLWQKAEMRNVETYGCSFWIQMN